MIMKHYKTIVQYSLKIIHVLNLFTKLQRFKKFPIWLWGTYKIWTDDPFELIPRYIPLNRLFPLQWHYFWSIWRSLICISCTLYKLVTIKVMIKITRSQNSLKFKWRPYHISVYNQKILVHKLDKCIFYLGGTVYKCIHLPCSILGL